MSTAAQKDWQKRWRSKPESRDKIKAQKARWLRQPSTPEKMKGYRLRARLKGYGLTLAQYNALLTLQNGLCAICRCGPSGSKTRLSVDHDHQTDEVRGLLCHHCNAALGGFRDNVLVLQAAIAYLESTHQHVRLVKDLI